MSLPKYPAYKETGIEWIGSVPQHWIIAPLKRDFDVIGGSTPKSDEAAYWKDQFRITPRSEIDPEA